MLLASGETADGVGHLVDRQHPHDFCMELSASVSQNIGPKSILFLYAGLPGEPAFRPPPLNHGPAFTVGKISAGAVRDYVSLPGAFSHFETIADLLLVIHG